MSHFITPKMPVSSCQVADTRVTIDGMRDKTYVDKGKLGNGLFARYPIREGEIIYRFSGKTIDFKEAASRGDKECWSLQIDKDTYIDTEAPGCYANHSCEPNAGIKNIVELIALRDIPADAEIRFDYSTTMDEDYYQMNCDCGCQTCRKVVTDFKWLPAATRERYLRQGIVMEFIARQYVVSDSTTRQAMRES
jgi:hypothetical protein